MEKTAVIGVGNILFKDEGIGIFIAKYLQENYSFSPNIEIIDAGTLGFRLMNYFEDYDKIILIDTISIKDKAGSIYKLSATELLGIGSYHQTAHEVEVVQMLELTSLKGKMADVTIIGIIPKDIHSSQIGLTETLQKSFPTAVFYTLKELENNGISYKKVNNLSLKDIAIKYFGSYNGELINKRISDDNYRQN